MANLSMKQIEAHAEKIVLSSPEGIRFAKIAEQIGSDHPETPPRRIQHALSRFGSNFPPTVTKPARGLYLPASAADSPFGPIVQQPPTGQLQTNASVLKEEMFYEPFADWLQNELEEVVKAVALGGSGMKDKWGTPDVLGVYRDLPKHRIKFGPDIVSAEIKIDPGQPVVAFGQAISYRLFSTKVYVVMPRTMADKDEDRLEALCLLFGVGLVFFSLDPAKPDFQIRARAQRHSPDMFYVNNFVDDLVKYHASIHGQLFF